MIRLALIWFAFHHADHPSHAVREAASRRADCLLGALLAPAGRTAEGRRRLDAVRSRRLGPWQARLAEWGFWRNTPETDPMRVIRAAQRGGQPARERSLAVVPLPPNPRTGHLCPPEAGTDLASLADHVGRERLAACGGGLVWAGCPPVDPRMPCDWPAAMPAVLPAVLAAALANLW